MDIHPQLTTFFLSSSSLIAENISIGKLLLTLFLVFLNGFFVAAEFAIVKVRSSQIEVNQNSNSKVTSIAKDIVTHLDSYLAATQLGITLASLGLGWVGESSLTPIILSVFDLLGLTGGQWPEIARSISFPVAFAIITILHIVFGELAPKTIAIHFPTKTTFAVALPLRIFYFVFKPVIWLMNGFANAFLRLIGITPVHGLEDIHSEEELKMIISESQEGGAIQETEHLLIQNVFDFDNRRVLNIQTLRKNISMLEVKSTVEEAILFAIKEGYSRYPVYEDALDDIKGIVYTKDLIKAYINNPEEATIEHLMREPIFISESALIKHVLKQFQSRHVQMAIVTNEVGEFTGIISMEDILEELVGEIQDEYDNEEPIVETVTNGIYIVNAHYTISDINRLLPSKFAETDHYDTLAGLISELYFDQELKENDTIELEGYHGTILQMYRNSVEKIQLTLKVDEEDED